MSLTATQMDLQIVILSEVREGELSWHPLHVESKTPTWKRLTDLDTESDSDLENELTEAGGGVGDSYGVWDWRVHTAVFKMSNRQGPIV